MRSTIIISLLLWLLIVPAGAQRTGSELIVQGKVTAKLDGEPLIGVNVAEVDASNRVVSGTVTDFDGRFILKVKI
mgnify:CR=1 FL=1